jgi:hypothetical protein
MSAPDRRALLDHDHGKPSIRLQCALLGVARSGVCRRRRMAAMLRAEGQRTNRKRVWPFTQRSRPRASVPLSDRRPSGRSWP